VSNKGWIGVDLDGTLAHYDHWRGIAHIGEPIQPMLERVKTWLAEGKVVKIFTARVHSDGTPERNIEVSAVRRHISNWLVQHVGQTLEITNVKDFQMIELWDDRAVQVIPNTGITIADELISEVNARSGKP